MRVHHDLLASDLPPLPQKGEPVGRERGVTILAALAAHQHALAVDVADLEGRDAATRRPTP